MVDGGVDASEYLMKKYGMSAEQLQAGRATLRARGAEVGFSFGERSRVWNTFDAHRLLFWAGQVSLDKQRALKHALLAAYHRDGRNPSDHAVLLELITDVGLDVDVARTILTSDLHVDDVRAAEKFWQQNGINAVPSVIINDRHLIQGGQSPDTFEQAIRQIVSTANSASQ
jgi:predicted DsbA family dithiol-disulfide isomerase